MLLFVIPSLFLMCSLCLLIVEGETPLTLAISFVCMPLWIMLQMRISVGVRELYLNES